MRRSSLLAAAVMTAALPVLSGCGDDPVAPPSGSWSDVVLPDLGTALLGVAARGARVVAIGYGHGPVGPEAHAAQSMGGLWRVLPLPTLPPNTVFMGVALDVAGRVVFVGGTPAEQPVIVDERAGWQATILPVAGLLNAVFAGRGDTLVAVGTASGGLAASSFAAGIWSPDRAGFTTAQEKGLVDVTVADGVFIACGWDDAHLQPVLRRRDPSGWTELPGPGGVTVPESHIEYRSVWLEPGGALWLGGTIIDTTGGGERYAAWLARRPSNGDWFEIVLPDPGVLEMVNDILRATDGSVYLACGQITGRVLRFDGTRWSDEGPGTPGEVVALAEAANGTIYAAGFRNSVSSQPGPLLRQRTP